jgi:hypothetical protein
VNLWTLLHDTRELHEKLLKLSVGHRDTKDSCAFAAYLLDFSVKRWLPQMRSCVRGGDGAADGGYFDQAGLGYAHYWVELDDGNDQWVADITADQFGGTPIVLMKLTEAEGRYVPGDAALVAEHMEVFGEWLAEAPTTTEPGGSAS